MKIRSLILAAFVLLVLVGSLYWSEHKKPSDDAEKASAATAPSILKLDSAAITKLELKRKDAEPVVLSKNDSGIWQITQPKMVNADQSAVSSAVSTLSSLNSERLVDDKSSNLKQYGLDQPAVEVDITEKDNKAQKLLIGDTTPTGNASYAMLAGDPRVFTIANYTKSGIDKSLNDLRDKRLLTVSSDRISRIELTRKNQTIEFGRDKNEWQILKPKPSRADSLQVDDLARKLTDARMDLSGPDQGVQKPAVAFARATPVATAKVTDQSGTQELQIRKEKDTYYAKSSAVEGTYKVDSSLAQAVDKNLDDFRNKKLFDFGFDDPGNVEMQTAAKTYFLTKGGADWWSNGKKMDAESVESLISDLRDLAASKFLEAGFANPTIEIKVKSDGGKRMESVSIAKSGAGYIAKREDDSTLYQIDASSMDAALKAADDIKPAATNSK
ncbi:MAG TPA: DUF4340 domain-containing protein [Terriglobales bacterium]|nr:DUF4340 domain-containing protein [Terriglobales bacterium]